MVDIKNITITSEILKLIAEIDEFKGRCKLSFHPSITSVNFILGGRRFRVIWIDKT